MLKSVFQQSRLGVARQMFGLVVDTEKILVPGIPTRQRLTGLSNPAKPFYPYP
ncbi:MAG: hypothetical protein AVDCRST_MAG86-1755 [uncultured Truepera sp.]|uniref:Uncharacterized protein n=1 Tax=uncultured Truepera sp. TaxID=543023 RepID=A0A6J4VBH6_9DEIN|nr:MAG: hypothetical protein AVDCRST_MAG86-1755 [uncultured Truepera sp.]